MFCRPDLRPDKPYYRFPYGMFGTPDCADVGRKTVAKPLSVKLEEDFPSMAQSFGLNTTSTACFVPACKMYIDGRCSHKDAKLSGPTVGGCE